MASSHFCRRLLVGSLIVGVVQSHCAHAHKDDYLGDTFVFVTLDRGEAEAEYWIDWRSDPRGFLHTVGFEYGVTEHFMLDFSARYAAPISASNRLETEFAEMRYRFGDEGDRPVDIAASVELENDRSDPADTHHLLEPRLVLSRDFLGWNATFNLVDALVLDESRRSAFEEAVGIRSPDFGRWNFGLEIQRERALEKSTRVLPQTWCRLSENTYIKAGAGYNISGEKNHFLRIAIETEF